MSDEKIQQKAIVTLRLAYHDLGDATYDDSIGDMREALAEGISAIIKRVPLFAEETQALDVVEYICPQCWATNGKFNYCFHCGQALICN